MKNTTTLSSKFRITIPKEVREAQNWKPGQEFAFIPKDGGYLLVPAPHINNLRGNRQGRLHRQLPRSQGPLLIGGIDTSAWIG